MRERIEYKGHHHVQKPRAFWKAWAVSELVLTPLWRMPTKSEHELILGHSPQTLTGRIVGKLYPRNPKHIRNKLRCDRNRNTSNTSNEMRYETVNPMHVGVAREDKWRARHKETLIPNCEWQWEGQCQQNDPKWLSVLNECLIGKSSPKIPCGHHHYRIGERKVHEQKRKRHQNEEDSRPEWIYV